jgi:2-methylcitrate dehydratase PrpD
MKRLSQITNEQAQEIIDESGTDTGLYAEDFAIGFNMAVLIQDDIEPVHETDERLTDEQIKEKCLSDYSLLK